LSYRHLESTPETCCPITVINQGLKVTSEKLVVQHGTLHFTANYLLKIFKDVGVTIIWSSNRKIPKIFLFNHPEKHQIFKCS